MEQFEPEDYVEEDEERHHKHAAYQAHPDRFVRRPPRPLPLPEAVWINRPVPNEKTKEERQ